MPRRVTFSERVGAVPPPNPLPLDSMSVGLRNSLWNLLLETVFKGDSHGWAGHMRPIWVGFLKLPADELASDNPARRQLKEIFFSDTMPWHRIYDLVQFVAERRSETCPQVYRGQFERMANAVLEENLSGYRFIGSVLAPITTEAELQSIQTSLRLAKEKGLTGAGEHLRAATTLLGKRPHPDYRNSVKESILAVESVVRQITGERGGGLHKALQKLDAKVHLHSAFKSGLEKLYGYSSDEAGIRHAMIDEAHVGSDEAKFMLVACSALVNYLAAKADDHGLLQPQ